MAQLGAGIAHELNSPLSGILILVKSYMRKKGPNSEEYKNLKEMEETCEHMAKIIRDLNAFTRQSKGEFIEMEFSDTGSGISKETVEKIFDPFFTTKRPGTGVGIGLYITHMIVNDHNGEILVESEPGKGATFKVRLPALKDA